MEPAVCRIGRLPLSSTTYTIFLQSLASEVGSGIGCCPREALCLANLGARLPDCTEMQPQTDLKDGQVVRWVCRNPMKGTNLSIVISTLTSVTWVTNVGNL